MPKKTITADAEMAVNYKNVKVYHTYEDDDLDEPIDGYCFVLEPQGSHNDGFQITDLTTCTQKRPPLIGPHNDHDEELKKAWVDYFQAVKKKAKDYIKKAIDVGEITQAGIKQITYLGGPRNGEKAPPKSDWSPGYTCLYDGDRPVILVFAKELNEIIDGAIKYYERSK